VRGGRKSRLRLRLHRARAEFAEFVTAPTSSVVDLVGGWRGMADALGPHAVFLIVYLATERVGPSVSSALAVALALSAIRLLKREPLHAAVAGAALVGVSALVAATTGEGTDFYLLDIARTTILSVVLVASLAIRRPLLGVLVGRLISGASWRSDRVQLRAYDLCTIVWAAAVVLRSVVKIPFYVNDDVVGLGIASIVMGVPLLLLTTHVQLGILRRAYAR